MAEWKDPFDWTEKEINQLVLDEVGKDVIFPRGSQILVKIWEPKKELEGDLVLPDHSIRNERITTSIGKIIRMGPEAFREIRR